LSDRLVGQKLLDSTFHEMKALGSGMKTPA